MDVEELLSFQPDKPEVGRDAKKRRPDERFREYEPPLQKMKQSLTDEEKEKILQMVENEEDDVLDETGLKKMILNFEKKVYRNQEMRIKYPDMPEKFMESEVELNEVIQEMHVVATVPDLYHILTELNAVQSLLQLLNHDNTDISIAVVDLLQEMTDVDSDTDDGANVLIDTLMEGQVMAQLVQNLERLDESVKEEASGVHMTLAIVENMMELRPDVGVEAAQQGFMPWLFKRMKAKMPFDANKLYCSEILAILLQNHEENRKLVGDMDGIDVILQQLAAYKRHDPSNSEEIEFMENLFDCLCSSLMSSGNRARFLKGEGVQLMNLMLREKKMSRFSAVKVLNHAMMGPEGADNCQKFVEVLGLRNVFPSFMKTPKAPKKVGSSGESLEEHIVSVISAMVRNCSGTQRQRLLHKFEENDHEKVERLMEMHFKYLSKVQVANERIQRAKQELKMSGSDVDEAVEDQFYIQRLDAGLFTLQLIDYIMLEISHSGPSGIKQRVMQILNMRGGSKLTIKGIMREYAGNVGDAMDEDARENEQAKILQLVDKF